MALVTVPMTVRDYQSLTVGRIRSFRLLGTKAPFCVPGNAGEQEQKIFDRSEYPEGYQYPFGKN